MFRLVTSPGRGRALAAALVIVAASPLSAQRRPEGRGPAPADLSDSALVSTVSFRSIGPAVMSGRIEDIAVASSPGARGGALGTVFYVGSASGGVWKTTNGGMSWTPVFDHETVASIGAVAVAPSNSDVVWVGTGEDNNQRSVSYGVGVYKSVDGGQTWTNMGLEKSQQVGRIRIHPDNPDIVWVASVGPMWAAGGERGIFKTTDGGKSWKQTLKVDPYTGAADLVLDPSNPDVMYASTHQRERRGVQLRGGRPGQRDLEVHGRWRDVDAPHRGAPEVGHGPHRPGRLALAAEHSVRRHRGLGARRLPLGQRRRDVAEDERHRLDPLVLR